MIKKIVIVGLLVLLFSSVVVIKDWSGSDDNVKIENEDDYETNYVGLMKLGLAPNAEPRLANDRDIDTGLRGEYQGIEIGLFESRTFEEGDFGRTFVSPINK